MKSKPYSRKSILEKLEERVLFDASPDGNLLPTSTVFDAGSANPLAMEASPQSTDVASQQQGVNLVFIAANADNVNARLNEILCSRPDKSFQVHWLGANSNSVAEIGQILESKTSELVESVWFLLNDQDGLSAESRNAENQWWAQQPGAIAGWSAHFSAGTELVLPGVENADLAENLERLTGATVLTNSPANDSLSPWALSQNAHHHSTTNYEIIFVDTSVENYESLLAELLAQRKAEVILLDGTSDGILQMAAALAGRSGIGAIHLISHGSEGILHVGTATLDAASMQSQYLAALTQIGSALDAEGDFLIYGCNFTAGDEGLKAAMILGGITEADIAASSDLTGHQGLNADWELESHVGVIQTSALIAHSWQGSLAPITFDPLNGSTVTAQTLADAIAGTGVSVISATFTGDNSQAGLFNNAQGYTPNWLTYDSGVLLSTGSLNQVLGPNTNGGSTVNAPGTGSNPDLAAIGGNTAFDAAVLEFTFIPTSNRITLQFTFGSEEYNEYVYSNFNDAMAVWINGINAATTPGNQTVSINSINQAATFNPANGNQTNDPNPSNGVFDSSSPSLYRNNAPNSGAFNTGMDGFTVTLTVVVDVNIGVSNTIRIGIADIGDASLDSFLFIRAESLQGMTIAETDSVATGVNLPVTIDVLENDFDSQGFPLTITHVTDQPITAGGPAITLGSGATVSLGLDGQLTYTPAAGYLGKDLLTYTVSNGNGNVAVGYIDISIVPKSRPIVDLNGNDFSPATTIADSFVLGNYNNNSGATNWSAGWIEGNDDGNPASGSIQIVNDGTPALRIGNAARTITRAANLSAYSHATLSFDFRRVGFDNINDFVAIEVSADGTNFTEIGRFYGPGDDATYSSFSAEISSFISANTTIRFRTSALLASNEHLFVDNVSITAIAPQTSFSNSYTENGSGVPISATTGAGVNIIDNDSSNLSRAIISITNAVAGDQLSITGTLPTGITAVFSGGGTTITLQGAATRALYETAIEQIRFSSTSNNPTALTRQISVVVYDESNLASNPAIASITVIPVNDDATAVNDVNSTNQNSQATGNVLTNDIDPENDPLTVTRVNGVAGNVGQTIAGSNGGTFVVNSNGSYTFNPGSSFAYLAAGQSATTSVSYSMTDGQGGLSTATVTITVNGLNDTPVSSPIANQSNNDSQTINFNISGFFSDPDTTDSLTFSLGSSSLPPGLSLNPSTGLISGTINSSASAGGPYSVTIIATDSLGASTSRSFIWVVANPTPISQNDAFTVGENGTISGNVFANNGNGVDSDPDGDTFSVTAVAGVAGNVGNATAGSNGGLFTIGSNGALAFNPNGQFDYLALGQTATTTITYTIRDANGATSTATVSVLVTGANDAPVTVGVIANQSGADSSSVSLNVSSFFADPDTTNTLTFSAGTTLPPGLSINPTTGLISGTLDSSASAGGPYTVVITATDPQGAFVTQTFVWTVTNPTPIARNDNFSVGENGTISGNVFANNGNGVDSDPDGDTFSVSAVAGVAGNVGNATAGSNGGLFTIGSNGTLAFNHNGQFDYLALGQTATTTITYTIRDANGATSTATVSVLVTGANDAPVTVGVISNQSGADSSSVSLNVGGFFADPDTSNTLTFSHGGTLPPGLSINPTTGLISGTLNSSASAGGPYTVVITATDPQGAFVTQTFVWTVTNPTPIARNDNFSVGENGTISGNVFANNGNGVDSDPDGDTFSVSAVAGVAGNVGNATVGSNGGLFTIGSNGTLAFNHNGQFDYLALGQTATTTITYTIRDANGATSTATVSVLVTGANDAPVTVGVISNQSGADSSSVSLNVGSFFADPDTSNTLTFSAGTTLPPGLSINPTTGLISGTLNSSASAGGPYTVVITATDPQGAFVTQTFVWTVTNPIPIARNDNFSVGENGTISGNVFANNGNGVDSDPDGDTFSVSAVAGLAGNVGNATAGSNGGLFTIGSNGTLAFNHNGQFDYLALGQTATTTITYTIRDADGATSTATVSVLVTGANDAPVTVGVISNQSGADSSSVSLNVGGFFADPDTSNTLTFSAGTTLPPGLSINPTTGLISGTLNSSASAGGPYTVVITATDPQGALVTQTFVWTVTNPAPVARNDNFSVGENGTIAGNVFANNGNGVDSDPDGDTFSVSAVAGVAGNVGNATAGSNGGLFTIGSNGTLAFNHNGQFDYLALGQTVTTTITYTITDANGATSTATVSVLVTGANDAPVTVGVIANQSGADSSSVSLNVSSFFADPDTSNTLTFSAGTTLPPGLSINPTTGLISGTLDSSASAGGPYTVVITATDPQGVAVTQTFIWTVTNPAPVAQNDNLTIDKDNSIGGNVFADNGNGMDNDPDGDIFLVTSVGGLGANVGNPTTGSNGGLFTINSDGSFSFNPNGDFDYLSPGDSMSTTISYSITDVDGATSTATVTLLVTGANDPPIAVGTISNQNGLDSSSVNLDVSSFFSDPNPADTLTFSAGTILPPGLSINPSTGVISGILDSSASAGGPYTVVITATDPHGASVTQTFVWFATNPVPVAQNDSFTGNEDGTISGNVFANNGNGSDSDPDGDVLSVSAVAGGAGNVGNATTGSNGGLFTINSDGTLGFDPNGEFDYLALGQSATTTISYTITDADGATSTATVSVLVTGSNDAPVTVGLISNQSGNDSSSVSLNVSGFFADPDTTNTLTYSHSGTLPPGLSIHPTTGVISGTLDSSASVGGPYTVVITATDLQGASVTQAFVWTVTNPTPVAQNDNFSVGENGTLSGNVFNNNGNGLDSDPDGDSFSVTAVAGVAVNVSNATAGSNGGLFTINGNGSLSFDANGDFDYLALGQSATTTITYIITDADGATSTATVSVLVTGSNDAPVTVGVIGNQSGNDSTSVNLDVGSFFDDPDTTNILTFSAGTNLPPGLSINPTTGLISGTLNSSASAGGPYTVVITATDPQGASVTQTFVWTVTNPTPVALNDIFNVNENGTVSGNVFNNNGNGVDNDPDGDAFSVTAVAGVAGNVGNATAGSHGGLFTIGTNGTLTFNPDGQFDYLALGQSATTMITYTITDADGTTSTATVSVLVTGANDAPVTVGVIANQNGTDSSSVNFNVSPFFADPDTSNTLTFSAGTTLPPGLSINPSTGVISGVLDNSASVGGPYTVAITATDPHGSSVTQTFVWVVSNPTPIAANDNPVTTENMPVSGNVLANDNDPDSDTLTVIEVNGASGNLGATIVGSNGGSFVINSNGTYSFNPGASFNDLSLGETRTTSVTYLISDGEGGTASATVTVTVQGQNDVPGSTPLLDQSGYDSDIVNLDVSGSFTDPDTSDGLTFSDSGTLPPGLSIDPLTGIISGTIDSSASVGGPYTVTITATDTHGASTSQTFTWIATNRNPVAVNDHFGINGTASATNVGNALINDSDADGDGLSIVPQTNMVGSNGGVFSIAADGTITFDPAGDFDHIHVTDSLTTTIQYTLIDADGATSTATISITVIGANQSPIANNDLYTVTGSELTGNAFDNDSDPNGDTLTGSVTIQPQHGSLVWQPDGTFTYTPGPSFLGNDQFTYVVRDIHGATSSAVVHINSPFAWDSFRNESIPSSLGRTGVGFWGIEQLVSYQLESLGSQPILAGYATPGAILKGRVYDLSGAMLAESTTQVNAAGNWVMNFYQTINSRNVIVIIDHVATEEVLLGDLHHFRLTDDTYRSLQLGAEHIRVMTPGTILSDRPSLVLEQMHRQNLNPLALL